MDRVKSKIKFIQTLSGQFEIRIMNILEKRYPAGYLKVARPM